MRFLSGFLEPSARFGTFLPAPGRGRGFGLAIPPAIIGLLGGRTEPLPPADIIGFGLAGLAAGREAMRALSMSNFFCAALKWGVFIAAGDALRIYLPRLEGLRATFSGNALMDFVFFAHFFAVFGIVANM
jgi:hypothetical protein